jgi:hypothetical protein
VPHERLAPYRWAHRFEEAAQQLRLDGKSPLNGDRARKDQNPRCAKSVPRQAHIARQPPDRCGDFGGPTIAPGSEQRETRCETEQFSRSSTGVNWSQIQNAARLTPFVNVSRAGIAPHIL